MRRFLEFAADRGVARRSVIVAAVVGTVLNLINQGDALLGAGAINWLKVCLSLRLLVNLVWKKCCKFSFIETLASLHA